MDGRIRRVLAEIAIQEQVAQQTAEQARKAEELRLREEEEQQQLRDAVRGAVCFLLPLPTDTYRLMPSDKQPSNARHT
jgi:uncharacterized protein Smg (DUF494 family)